MSGRGGRGRGGGGGGKRKGGDEGGGGKKVKYAQKHAQDPAPRSQSGQALALGSRGVLVTCEQTKEDRAGHEAQTIFEEHYNKLKQAAAVAAGEAPSTSGTAGATPAAAAASDDVKDIGALIAQEVAELKDQKGKPFRTHHTGVKGCVYIIFPQQPAWPSPEDVVLSVVREVKETKTLPCRYILRLLPVAHTCYASIDAIKEAAPKMLAGHFPEEGPAAEFSVEYEHRSADNFDRMSVINAFVDAVKVPPHKVNLSAPTKTVLVQLLRNGCGVSVVAEYKELMRYNLRKLAEPEEDEATKKDKAEKAEQAKVARAAKKVVDEAKKAADEAAAPAPAAADVAAAAPAVKAEPEVKAEGGAAAEADAAAAPAAEVPVKAEVKAEEASVKAE